MTSTTHVHVVDLISGRQIAITAADARPMSKEEIEQYNDTPAARDPSKKEIARQANLIKASWSGDERKSRSRSILEFISLIEG